MHIRCLQPSKTDKRQFLWIFVSSVPVRIYAETAKYNIYNSRPTKHNTSQSKVANLNYPRLKTFRPRARNYEIMNSVFFEYILYGLLHTIHKVEVSKIS